MLYSKYIILILTLWVIINYELHLHADIDECSTSSHSCDVNALCSNIVGTYTCACKTGYSGDGRTCAGKLLRRCKDLFQNSQ